MLIAIALNLVICFAIAGLSGWVTRRNLKNWYPNLIKPSFHPPSWIFGPVWTVLYCMIAIVGGILWSLKSESPAVFGLFMIQLGLNFSWSFVFFGARRIGLAFLNLFMLWMSILCLLIFTFPLSILGGILLIPYFIWTSFALLLNAWLWKLNPN
jgi:benzodiazapine receptor